MVTQDREIMIEQQQCNESIQNRGGQEYQMLEGVKKDED